MPWWSRSQGTRSHATPRRVRCYPVSARYSRVAGLCLPMRAGAHTPWRHRGFGSRSICFAPPRQACRPDRGLHTFSRRHLASREEEFRAVLPPLHFGRRGDPRDSELLGPARHRGSKPTRESGLEGPLIREAQPLRGCARTWELTLDREPRGRVQSAASSRLSSGSTRGGNV